MSAAQSLSPVQVPAAASVNTETAQPAADNSNPVKRVADEILQLMGDIHDHKQEIMARGIQINSINVMVELRIKGELDDTANIWKTSLESSARQHGAAAITAEKLDEHISALASLERDLAHVRKISGGQGFNMTALNHLTAIIRLSPGDGGETSLNHLLAYATACGVSLERVDKIVDANADGPQSVLPDIAREDDALLANVVRNQIFTDICVGCCIAVIALALLT